MFKLYGFKLDASAHLYDIQVLSVFVYFVKLCVQVGFGFPVEIYVRIHIETKCYF